LGAAEREVVGEGKADEQTELLEEPLEKTESIDERTLDTIEVLRTAAAWMILGSAEKEAYSINDSALL
jgi:hypothetical protein